MPARFAGYVDGRETWNFLQSDASLWDCRSVEYLADENSQPVADAAPVMPPILMKHVEGVRFSGHHSVQIIMSDVDVIREFIATTERALAAKPTKGE